MNSPVFRLFPIIGETLEKKIKEIFNRKCKIENQGLSIGQGLWGRNYKL
jgi:hypothetical protein